MITASAVALIPNAAEFLHGFRPAPVQLIYKLCVSFLAVPVLPGHLNLQGPVEDVLLGVHDIGKVAERPGIKGGRRDVNVQAAALVGKSAAAP